MNQDYHRRYHEADQDYEQETPLWLITFTDVIALMLTFFVLLFAMAEPDKQQWSDVTSALKQEFSRFYGAPQFSGEIDAITLNKVSFSKALDLEYLEALLERQAEGQTSLKGITINRLPDSLAVSLPNTLLFESGNFEIGETGEDAIFTLAAILGRIRNRIEILGHADPRPGQTETTNWMLSVQRAYSVASSLANSGYSRPIQVRGASSGQYDDLNYIQDDEKKLELSRRVDILIMKDAGTRVNAPAMSIRNAN